MHLSGLFIYPVKSLRGLAVTSAEIDDLGLVGDRRFMVVDDTGRFLTQRTLPRMALIATALSPTTLTLSVPGQGGHSASGRHVDIPRAPDPHAPLRTVSVWKSEGLQAEDCGPAAAALLSDFLGHSCHLVRLGPSYQRPMLKKIARPGDNVSFADAEPFLVISEASLADLNDRLVARGEEPLPLDRFRTNFVIAGAPAPFAEDTWPRFRLGTAIFRAGGPCARCLVTTTDQLTAERGKEPLRTLATYRRDPADPTDVNFGQNLIHETKSGTVRLGDSLHLL